jgi:hypothetical protein
MLTPRDLEVWANNMLFVVGLSHLCMTWCNWSFFCGRLCKKLPRGVLYAKCVMLVGAFGTGVLPNKAHDIDAWCWASNTASPTQSLLHSRLSLFVTLA